jgi:hypothetical protein
MAHAAESIRMFVHQQLDFSMAELFINGTAD